MRFKSKKKREAKVILDTPGRSIAKAVTWRIIASGTTFLITFVIFKRFTDQNVNEVIENASLVTSIEVVAKIVFYYLHERMWTNIAWGRFWERRYWRQKAWRKLYRSMHKQTNTN